MLRGEWPGSFYDRTPLYTADTQTEGLLHAFYRVRKFIISWYFPVQAISTMYN